jgi:hypothetical protein
MGRVFKVDVHGPGLTVWTSRGDEVEFEGRPMVRLDHGTIVDAGDYYPSLAAAKRAAADRIEAIREDLSRQAGELRAEAFAHERQEPRNDP